MRSLSDHVVVAISCGRFHTLLLTSEGHIYSFGCDADGALGTSESPLFASAAHLSFCAEHC